MLEDVKQALRVSTDDLDTEVQDIIDAAKMDLKITGINPELEDPLIKRAIIIYAKSHFGLDNQDSEKYMQSYTSLKIHLALSPEYEVV